MLIIANLNRTSTQSGLQTIVTSEYESLYLTRVVISF